MASKANSGTAHAVQIYKLVKGVLTLGQPDAELSPRPDPFVYYLMLSPSTVKIGTTIDLRRRVTNQLRSDLQYVVAIERGGLDLERQRHSEFASERLGKREDFRLSPRLKRHIETLMPDRDELVGIATK